MNNYDKQNHKRNVDRKKSITKSKLEVLEAEEGDIGYYWENNVLEFT